MKRRISELESVIMKTVPLNSNEKMDEWKISFPAAKDGGPTWDEIACAGLLSFKNEYKFKRQNELYADIKEVFNVGNGAQ
jgi:hypothetical protein